MNTSKEISFHEPDLTAYYMPRPRLDKIMEQATRCRVVYVIASAAYGKTLAVRHYIKQQQDVFVRWMQLTDSDNTTSRFWENLTHIISIDNPDIATKLREFGFPETHTQFKQLVEIINDRSRRQKKTFYVFDDFHLLHNKDILTFIERYAHLKTSGVCIIIIARKEPEINIVSLFSKRNLSIITEKELCFTTDEATDFFRQCQLPLSANDLSQMMDATDGWPFAISMFALIMKKVPNQFKYALEAVRQNIFKLLESEAWADLPETTQKTVLKMALLSDLPAMPLREIFYNSEFFENAPNLSSFIGFRSLTNDFEVHPLYLEFLQNKHHLLSDEEKQEMYRHAAEWCYEHELYMNAMHYYAQSQQFDRMVKILFTYPLKLSSSASEYLLELLENLKSEDSEQSCTDLLFLKNFFTPLLLTGAGRYDEAKERSLAVISEWENVDTPISTLFLYTTYSNLAYIDMYTCTATHTYESPMYLKKSVEYLKRGEFPPSKASAAFLSADLRSFACLVGEGASLSEFEQFLEAVKQTEQYIEETHHNVYAGYEDLVLCEYTFFKNKPELARTHAHKAIQKASKNNQYSIVAMAKKYLLRIAAQEGNATLVKELLKQLKAHLEDADFWSRQLYYDLYTGIFFAHIGLLEKVPQWLILDDKEAAFDIHIPTRELYVRTLYYIFAKKYQQALTILCSSYPREPQERFLFGELRFALLTAVARVRSGDTDGAMADFKKAYALSFQGLFELPFIELGKEIHPVIVAALKQTDCDIPQEWLKTIDRKASIYAKKSAFIANALEPSKKEPIALSARERDVLIDLYHGLSRDEIAENQYLSINTVKKALQSIYIKLGAYNNVDAIRIALEKKLIE